MSAKNTEQLKTLINLELIKVSEEMIKTKVIIQL